jgi:chromosome segregation ATPase
MDAQVTIALISTGGGVLITWLTLKYKDGLKKKNVAKAPKDRMESIFDGYESLIRELKEDSVRKSVIIENLQVIIDTQRDEINKSQSLINKLRDEVDDSTSHAVELKTQLDKMKKDYAKNKDGIM